MRKNLIKRLLSFVLTFTFLLSAAGVGVYAESGQVTSGLSVLEKTDEYSLVAQDGNLRLYLNTATTNFYVEDAVTAQRTYAYPENLENDESLSAVQKVELQSALTFTIWEVDRKSESVKNSNGVCVKQGKYTVYSQKNGFLIEYRLDSQKITVCLSVSLKDGKLLCSIPANSIKEEQPEKVKLLRISILPYMICGLADTDGQIILPDGCGEILDFNSSRANAAVYSKPIYGRDLSTELTVKSETGYDITCPYIAMAKNEVGILSVFESGAAVGYVNANPSGKSTPYANAYFSYDYRTSDIATIGDKKASSSQSTRVFSENAYTDDVTVSYSFLWEDVTVFNLAHLYGEYLAPGSHAYSDEEHTAIFDIYGFVNEKKNFLGFPYTAVSVLSKGEDIISFAQDDSLSGVTLNLKNMTSEQKNYTVQSNLKPISKVLTTSQLEKLSKSNVNLYINVNPISFRKGTLSANSFFSASKTIYGAPVGVYEYRESTHLANNNIPKSYLLKPNKISNVVNKIVKSALKLNVDGFSSDELGKISYNDYSSDGTLVNAHLEQEKAIANAAENCGIILSNPNDYAIKYCTAVTDIPTSSSNDDLCCGSYPFIQIALGDKISYTVEAINLHRSPETMFLQALSTGSALHYSYILSDTQPIIDTELNFLYSADYSAFKDMTLEQLKNWREVNGVTDGSALVDYVTEGDCVTSVFENGVKLVVNFDEKTYSLTE